MKPSRKVAPRQEVSVIVDADFLAGPARCGTLYFAVARDEGIFSFAYDPPWLKHGSAFQIDPHLQLHSSEVYLSGTTADVPGVSRFSARSLGARTP